MDTSLCEEIFSHAEVMKSWMQSLKIESVNSTNLIDLSVAIGLSPKVPTHATDQPSFHYPRGSCYRFNTSFNGISDLDLLCSYLNSNCIGCTLQRPTGGKTSVGRIKYYLKCKCSRYRTEDVMKIFETSKLSQSNTKVETIKQQRSLNEPGTLSRMASSEQQTLFLKESRENRKKPEQTSKRTECGRCMPGDSRFRMCITIFLNSSDEFWYLHYGSTLHHTVCYIKFILLY